MAKVSPIDLIENHIEKIILVICVLALVVVGYIWIIGSPRSLELTVVGRPQKVSPAQADETLARTASTVRQRVADLQPPQMPRPAYLARIRQRQDEPLEAFPRLLDMAFPGVAIAEAGPGKIPPVNLEALREALPAPGVPKVRAEWERLRRQAGAAADADIAAAHVAAVYPWGELRTRWQEILSRTTLQDEPLVWRVLGRVQSRQPGGEWGPVESVRMVGLPLADFQGNVVEPPEIPDYDGNNTEAIAQAVEAWGDESWQAFLLQPDYWPVWRPGVGWVDWRVHLPETEVAAAGKQAAANRRLTRWSPRRTRCPSRRWRSKKKPGRFCCGSTILRWRASRNTDTRFPWSSSIRCTATRILPRPRPRQG